jgi:nucleoside-diphosphate-sugar epimerase
MPYARAKGKAEDWVRRLESGPTNVVVLRPGLIWGPRSPWVAGPAVDIDRGVAYLFDGGRGACNLMYVDNLCYSITAVARRGGPTAFYNVGDPDRPDWSAYYRGLARVVGRADVPIHGLDAAQFRASLGERLEFLKETSAFRYLKKRLRGATKAAIKHHLGRLRESGVPHAPAGSPRPRPTRSMWWLQTVRSWLPTQRFDTTYPIAHRLSFGEALERTGAWLRFAGFGC